MTTARRPHGTMPASMSPRRKEEHRIDLDPAYRRALAKRVEALADRGITMREVAGTADLTRQSLWRLIRDADQRATVEQAERVRRAIMKLDPSGPPIPPPMTVTLTRGPSHPTWRAALRSERKR